MMGQIYIFSQKQPNLLIFIGLRSLIDCPTCLQGWDRMGWNGDRMGTTPIKNSTGCAGWERERECLNL